MKVLLAWWSVALLIVASLPGSAQPAPSVQKDGSPSSITVSTPKAAQLGSPILVEITMTNVSSKTLCFVQGAGSLLYVVELRDDAGKMLEETEKGAELNRHHGHAFSTYGKMITVKPGENRKTTFAINEWFKISTPGKYFVRVLWYWEGKVVESNVAPLTVTN
jgi:hypothetical protein